VVREGVGAGGGEMTQALYAHMNKIKLKKRIHLQNNQSKMDWRCGSRSRVPVLQAQSTEFKPQSLPPPYTKKVIQTVTEKVLLSLLFKCALVQSVLRI
jgi:hypothetical protein